MTLQLYQIRNAKELLSPIDHFISESEVIKLSPSHKYSIEAFLGGRRKITCEFHGRPPIKVTWYKAGTNGLPPRIEKHGGSLIIQKVALSDAGQYFCHGNNAFSSLTAYVNVSVYGKYVTDTRLTK